MDEIKRILVADSGATKTDWVCLTEDASGMTVTCISASGLSPVLHPDSFITSEFRKVASELGNEFDRIRFYGAGIGTPELEFQMQGKLQSVFTCEDIIATSDVLGAAKALYGRDKGIACIMGTGSSSCHFDGIKIDFRAPSLGYLLDDEGGGVAFGRRLLADIFKKTAPAEIQKEFLDRYPLTREDLLRHLYKESAPNRWMASFFPFIAGHQENPYISDLIDSQLDRFLAREFAAYPEDMIAEEGVAFVGSVADILKSQLRTAFDKRGWKLNQIIRKPIENIYNLTT